ncbi:hypothetical protein [Saccharopolyspora karakumensis]|nr:hypothetical protein [Saccharopolyspora karakumensis]
MPPGPHRGVNSRIGRLIQRTHEVRKTREVAFSTTETSTRGCGSAG